MSDDEFSEPIRLDYRKLAIWLWLLAAVTSYFVGITSILVAILVAVAVHCTIKWKKAGGQSASPSPADRLPRFSIKRLLAATTLVAIGAGMIGLVPTVLGTDGKPSEQWWSSYYLFGGPALMGAGFGTPFRRPLAGAICGVVLFALLSIAVAVWFIHA